MCKTKKKDIDRPLMAHGMCQKASLMVSVEGFSSPSMALHACDGCASTARVGEVVPQLTSQARRQYNTCVSTEEETCKTLVWHTRHTKNIYKLFALVWHTAKVSPCRVPKIII